MFPAKAAQQKIRNRLKYVTSRRADQSEGIRGDGGRSDGAGVGQLLPAYQRQPSFPRVAAFRQHPFSQVLDPEK